MFTEYMRSKIGQEQVNQFFSDTAKGFEKLRQERRKIEEINRAFNDSPTSNASDSPTSESEKSNNQEKFCV